MTVWDDQHARLRAELVNTVEDLDNYTFGSHPWAQAADRALSAYDACLHDVERLYPERNSRG